jgi:hypothetical protein
MAITSLAMTVLGMVVYTYLYKLVTGSRLHSKTTSTEKKKKGHQGKCSHWQLNGNGGGSMGRHGRASRYFPISLRRDHPIKARYWCDALLLVIKLVDAKTGSHAGKILA